jgi:hypothetical protein
VGLEINIDCGCQHLKSDLESNWIEEKIESRVYTHNKGRYCFVSTYTEVHICLF